MSIEKQDKIDRYLRGEMQTAEAEVFEKSLSEDEELRTAYEETLLLAETIEKVAADEETRRAFETVSEEEMKALLKEKRSGRRFLIRAAWMAAAILVAVVVVEFIRMPAPGSPEGVYFAYFEPYPVEEEAPSRGADSPSVSLEEALRPAFSEYQKKNYVEALAAFQALEKDAGNECTEIYLYKAICQMKLNQYTNAIQSLQSLVADGESNPYYQPACWYLSLAHLKNNEREKAEHLLQQIVQDDGFYAEKARAALKRLD